MYFFSNLFWYRTLHVSDRFTVNYKETSAVHTAIGICRTCNADCLLANSLANSQQTCTTNTYFCVYNIILPDNWQ